MNKFQHHRRTCLSQNVIYSECLRTGRPVLLSDAPGRDLTVVGVTGSHGKTTVSWLICGILEAMEQITGEMFIFVSVMITNAFSLDQPERIVIFISSLES